MSQTGSNLAVAGKAGFALYSSGRRKWKLFGNEVQEQGLICRGGLAWYHDVLVFPCRVQEKSEEVRGSGGSFKVRSGGVRLRVRGWGVGGLDEGEVKLGCLSRLGSWKRVAFKPDRTL